MSSTTPANNKYCMLGVLGGQSTFQIRNSGTKQTIVNTSQGRKWIGNIECRGKKGRPATWRRAMLAELKPFVFLIHMGRGKADRQMVVPSNSTLGCRGQFRTQPWYTLFTTMPRM